MTTTATGVSTLADLRGIPKARPAWHAELVQREMNGGTTTESSLAFLDEWPEVTALTVSGLGQKCFEHLVQRHGERLTALHLWKCPRIEDLTPLEAMPGLTHVAMFWNRRAPRLWKPTTRNSSDTPRSSHGSSRHSGIILPWNHGAARTEMPVDQICNGIAP